VLVGIGATVQAILPSSSWSLAARGISWFRHAWTISGPGAWAHQGTAVWQLVPGWDLMERRHPAKRPLWAGSSGSRFLADELSIKQGYMNAQIVFSASKGE
jgi:hypothetical protein